ncbi:hypothetical protein [Methanospirillum hungatei]|uniref:hypothetical protein n=1 Tax=Methanospirillum hungatei TaxID=2203 RepID=UPI00005DFBF8|nr:hypothetical protein [Methanospirillum hungatei]
MKRKPPERDQLQNHIPLGRDPGTGRLLDILARFIHLQKEEKTREGKKHVTERIIFPRYHLLQAVRNVISDARKKWRITRRS